MLKRSLVTFAHFFNSKTSVLMRCVDLALTVQILCRVIEVVFKQGIYYMYQMLYMYIDAVKSFTALNAASEHTAVERVLRTL